MGIDLQTVVGRQIRQFRLGDNLTIEELAFRAHLHPNYLGDIERGNRNPTLLNLKKIAEGLNKPLTSFFTGIRTDTAGATRKKPATYLSQAMDKALLSLVKSLRKNSEKDQAYIIQTAKVMSSKLKKIR